MSRAVIVYQGEDRWIDDYALAVWATIASLNIKRSSCSEVWEDELRNDLRRMRWLAGSNMLQFDVDEIIVDRNSAVAMCSTFSRVAYIFSLFGEDIPDATLEALGFEGLRVRDDINVYGEILKIFDAISKDALRRFP